jgi:chromosome segregation ATPase
MVALGIIPGRRPASMIEPIMFFGIGVLAASLFGLMLIPLVHNRAVRLTMRRLEAATPLSMAEIQADKDHLRAEFAMSTRRLELSVDQMKSKTTGQLAELGKKSDSINRLKVELGDKTAAIFSLEAREKSLKDQLQATEAEHSVKIGALHEAERMLSEKQAELAKVSADLGEQSVAADNQRVEATALRVQLEALRGRITQHEREANEISDRLTRERQDAIAATAQLNEARGKVEKLSDRVIELERALVAQATEGEILGRRISELETRMVEQGKLLSGREAEIVRLNETVAASQKTEVDLRGNLATASLRNRAVIDGIAKEKLLIEDQLVQSKAERAKLQLEIAAMKREAEQTWAAERVENALLRERINDIAAEIARLTFALDGANSPIEAMLASEPAAANGHPPAAGERKPATAGGGGKGNLADRIRALQGKASRLPARS